MKKLVIGLFVLGIAVSMGVGIGRAAGGEALTVTKIADGTTNFTTLTDADSFGQGAVSIGDLDGDGVEDLAIGARNDDDIGISTLNYGAVYILFMNSDSSVKSTVRIDDTTTNFASDFATNDQFGVSIASIGDFNGDSVQDIAVTSASDDQGGANSGALYLIYLTTSGGVSGYDKIAFGDEATVPDGEQVGNIGVTSLGDLAGDGTTAFAVGAYNSDSSYGAVYIVFANPNGTVASTAVINDATTNFTDALRAQGSGADLFGVSVENIGDLDGNGRNELAVGSFYGEDTAGPSNSGVVYIIHLSTAGGVESYTKINASDAVFSTLPASSYFGSGISLLGDITGDGDIEIAIGAEGFDSNKGGVFITTVDSSGEPTAMVEISSLTGGMSEITSTDGFGSAVGKIADIDGDGRVDLLVGAYRDDTGGSNRGAAYILNLDGVSSSSDDSSSSSDSSRPVVHSIRYVNGLSCAATSNYLEIKGYNLYRITVSDNLSFIKAQVHSVLYGNGSEVLPSKFVEDKDAFYLEVPKTADTLYLMANSKNGNQGGVVEIIAENVTCDEGETAKTLKLPEEESLVIVDDGSSNSVYIIGNGLKKRPFLNEEIFVSWMYDFSNVEEVSREVLEALELGLPMLFKGPSIMTLDSTDRTFYITENQHVREVLYADLLPDLFGLNWRLYARSLPSPLFNGVLIARPISRFDIRVVAEWGKFLRGK